MSYGIKTKYVSSVLGKGGLPDLTATPGSLIALLDAFLVNGWNTRTVQSMAVAQDGKSALLSYAAPHGYTAWQVLRTSGANEAWANGDFRITSVPSALSVVVGLVGPASAAASGAITSKCAPAGWTKPLNSAATYEAAYRPNHAEAPYLYLKDDRNGTNVWSEARGYLTLPAFGSGTGPFPNATQRSVSPWAGAGAFSTPGFLMVADDRTFYIVCDGFVYNDWPRRGVFAFGEFDTFEPIARTVSANWMFMTGRNWAGSLVSRSDGQICAYRNGDRPVYTPYNSQDVVSSTPCFIHSMSRIDMANYWFGCSAGAAFGQNPIYGNAESFLPLHLGATDNGNYYIGALRGMLDQLSGVQLNTHQLVENVPLFGQVIRAQGVKFPDTSSSNYANVNNFSLCDWY